MNVDVKKKYVKVECNITDMSDGDQFTLLKSSQGGDWTDPYMDDYFDDL